MNKLHPLKCTSSGCCKKPFDLRILFLSSVSPHDRNAWSGITHALYHALSTRHSVHWPGPPPLTKWDHRILHLWQMVQDLLGRKFTSHHRLNGRLLARSIQPLCNENAYDCIVIGSGETELFAYLKTRIPIYHVADATFSLLLDYYPWHTGLCSAAIRQGNQMEARAIRNAGHIFYSSAWSADSAVKYFNADRARISLAAFGPGLRAVSDEEYSIVKEQRSGRDQSVLNLLFVGTNWMRKGGSIAYETFRNLKALGIQTEFSVVGCNPEIEPVAGLRVFPFLDKNSDGDTETLIRLYKSADLLILPSRADCTPIVFSESASFGVPVISTVTGGIPSIVRQHSNGILLPLSAGAGEFTQEILSLWSNKEKMEKMRAAARQAYKERLNWGHWLNVFEEMLSNQGFSGSEPLSNDGL